NERRIRSNVLPDIFVHGKSTIEIPLTSPTSISSLSSTSSKTIIRSPSFISKSKRSNENNTFFASPIKNVHQHNDGNLQSPSYHVYTNGIIYPTHRSSFSEKSGRSSFSENSSSANNIVTAQPTASRDSTL